VSLARIVVDPDLVVEVAVQVRVELRLEDRVEDGKLAHFLRLERLGASSTSPSRLPRMLVENQPFRPGGGPSTRREDRLHEGLAGLEVLSADRDVVFFGELDQGGMSTVRFGAPFAKGTPE